jgi:hypothetical protein
VSAGIVKDIVEVPYEIDLRTAAGERMGEGRAPGHHVSDLVRGALGKTWSDIEGEQKNVRAHAGFLFEAALEWAFKRHQTMTRHVETQIRASLEGISGTPDGLNLDDHWLESYKLTWRSERKWLDDATGNFATWFLSEAIYIHMLSATGKYPLIPGVRFFVFWIMGDYSYRAGHGPAVKQYLVTYTDEGVKTAWRTILAEARLRDRNREKVAQIRKRKKR